MGNPLRITSAANDRVKALIRLRGRRERDRQGLMIVEESLVIARALAAGHPIAEVWACPEQHDDEAAGLYRTLADLGAPRIEVPPTVMDRVAYRKRSDGLLLVAPRRRPALGDLNLPAGRPPLLVVLEAVEKPGNLGAVLRIADGAGADAVLVCGDGVELDNPNCLRASRGAAFSVPTVAASTDEVIAWLGRNGIDILAASPEGTEYWDHCDLGGAVAVILGAEHEGLTPRVLAAAARTVAIPMLGTGDSLNVSSAAAILLYEAARQRTDFRKADRT